MLYSFELLNLSIVFTNITWKPKSEQNDELSNITRFACANFRRVLHKHLSSGHRYFFEHLDPDLDKNHVKFHHKRKISLCVKAYQSL